MSKWGWGETIALLSLIIAIATFVTPEIRCALGLPSESCQIGEEKGIVIQYQNN